MAEILFSLVRDADSDRRFKSPGTVRAVQADGFLWPAEVLDAVANERMGLLRIPNTAPSVFEDLNTKEITRYQDARTGAQMVRHSERCLDLAAVLAAATKIAPGTWTIARATLRNAPPDTMIYTHHTAGPLASAPAHLRA